MTSCNEFFDQSLRMVSSSSYPGNAPSSIAHPHTHTHTGKSLIWVAVLGVIVLFIYAVVSFAFLSEAFRASNNSDGDLFCTTLYECFISTIRYGLIDNLGLVTIIPHVQLKQTASQSFPPVINSCLRLFHWCLQHLKYLLWGCFMISPFSSS